MPKNDGSAPPSRLAAARMEEVIFQKAGMSSGRWTADAADGMEGDEMGCDGVAYLLCTMYERRERERSGWPGWWCYG